MLSDIEIAQSAKMLPITEIAEKLDILPEELELYGRYKAKLSEDIFARLQDKPDGKLVLVTAINPTPAGEGKTTTSVGLGQAMARIGEKAVIALREPSLGPVFGIKGGGYAVRFVDETDWKEYILNVEDVVILRKFFNHHPIAGDGNQPINNTLTMIKASDEGLTEALTVANKVRGLLKQKKAMLAPEDVKKSTDDFVNRFKTAAKEGGIIGVDSMEDFTPLNVTPWSTNAAQMREIRENLFYYWRISEPILKSSYTSDQWQAFYESVIEPILIQMGQAFTNACFTQREKDVGNRIIFTSSAMINASTSEKVQLVNATREIGLMTTNEQRELFGLPPVEGGDERIISLNYIKQSDMSKYQTGQEPQEDPGNTGGQEPQGDQGGQEPAAEEGAGDGGKGGEESGE